MARSKGTKSTVYVLHFNTPFKHAAHYCGFTTHDLAGRIEYHTSGRGSRLMAAVTKAGITFEVALEIPGTRDDERRLKNKGSLKRSCPICKREQSRAAS